MFDKPMFDKPMSDKLSKPTKKPAIWAVVPAAGIGMRMQRDIPKQYLTLLGRPVIAHTVERLLSFESITGLVISLQTQDTHWDDISILSSKPLIRAPGGVERCDSVHNALQCLQQSPLFNIETDWVMVHDAVRPCIRESDICQLIEKVGSNTGGGLLALPVRDTMKRQRSDQPSVHKTIEREGLWHALTPQYFPMKQLKLALENAMLKHHPITDEASAMEQAGYSPILVDGHEDNIKITRPNDLRLAELYLSHLL